MNKKKIVAFSLVVCLLATAVVGGSLAYFTDTDEATNVFAVGNVKIEQHEQERVKDENGAYTDELQDFTQNQTIVPAVYPGAVTKDPLDVNGYEIQIRDESVANYVDKIISVENKGVSDAYIRTFIAIPYNEAASAAAAPGNQVDEWFHWNAISDTDTDPANGWYWGTEESGEWPADAETNSFTATIDGTLYKVYVVTNVNIIPAGEFTGPCFAGFYLDDDVDCEVLDDGSLNYYITIAEVKYDLGDISTLNILVASQAVQAQGFADAWTALDEAFGPVGVNNHPWAE